MIFPKKVNDKTTRFKAAQNQNLGSFKWAETHQATTYTNWHPGQPSNGGGYEDEDCVFTTTLYSEDGVSFGWNDAPCDNGEVAYALCMINLI